LELQWTANGKWIFATDTRNSASFWDGATMKRIWAADTKWKGDPPVKHYCLSTDGRMLLSVRKGSVELITVEDGRPCSASKVISLPIATDGLKDVRFGKSSNSSNYELYVQYWDRIECLWVEAGEIKETAAVKVTDTTDFVPLQQPNMEIWHQWDDWRLISYSLPDRTFVVQTFMLKGFFDPEQHSVINFDRGFVYEIDIVSGKALRSMQTSKRNIVSLQYSSKLLLLVEDNLITAYDRNTWEPTGDYLWWPEPIKSVHFSPANPLLLCVLDKLGFMQLFAFSSPQ